jgi:hypothetical protein
MARPLVGGDTCVFSVETFIHVSDGSESVSINDFRILFTPNMEKYLNVFGCVGPSQRFNHFGKMEQLNCHIL